MAAEDEANRRALVASGPVTESRRVVSSSVEIIHRGGQAVTKYLSITDASGGTHRLPLK